MPDPPVPLPPTARRSPTPGPDAADARLSERVRALPTIPMRYGLREKEGNRFIHCDDAPRLRVFVEPGMSVSRSEAAALGQRVILLDGAGSFGPMIDNEKQLYNLDHHAGCERLFTLATCEQALLLVQGGLELSEGDWTVYANEPDLDTVLAIWCLLNHRRLRELRPEARDVLLPLFRLEGAIDANGHELARLCGLTSDLLEQTQRRIDALLAREAELKRAGSWNGKGMHAYTLEMLRTVDALVYRREDFGDYAQVEEVYGHVEVTPRNVAVACRDRSGIYQVEQHLKERWGDQLSLIALEKQPGHFTLRRVRSVAGPQLEPAYALLNKIDPAVDGRPPGKNWGGSGDIGGSPRNVGTRLRAEEVLDALARAYRPWSRWTRTRASIGAFAVGLSYLLFWPLAAALTSLVPVASSGPGLETALRAGLASLLALAVGAAATRMASDRRPWVFGWRLPANGGGWWLAPLFLVGVAPVAAWASRWRGAEPLVEAAMWVSGILVLASSEIWFRGLVHGLLVVDFPVQRPNGPWRLSRAALVSAGAQAMAMSMVLYESAGRALAPVGADPLQVAVGLVTLGFATGLGLAALRERCLSFVPGLLIQVVGLLLWGVFL